MLNACTKPDPQPLFVPGMKPVYVSKAATTHIYADIPRSIVHLGKIYAKSPYIYINDSGMGVHVIDNTIPSDPQRIAFIHIPGNNDIAIKDNYLYADNFTDLVTLDISDWQNISVVSRVKNLYSFDEITYPINYNGYFECADSTKGIVIAWETTTLENPKCLR